MTTPPTQRQILAAVAAQIADGIHEAPEIVVDYNRGGYLECTAYPNPYNEDGAVTFRIGATVDGAWTS